MLINWFTVIAQIINFLILVYLLYRFLYKPITQTMGERQKRLSQRWQDAEEEREKASREAESYRRQRQELEAQQAEIFAETREKAEQERREMLRQARAEVEQKQAEWQQAIAQQQENFLAELRQQMAWEIYTVSRRALQDLANADLERQAIAVFIDRLRHLDREEEAKQNGHALLQDLREAKQDVVVRSSFAIPQPQREEIIVTLREKQIVNGNNVEFATTPGLIFGIQLQSNHQEIAWNLDHYLQDLEEHFASQFEQARPSDRSQNLLETEA